MVRRKSVELSLSPSESPVKKAIERSQKDATQIHGCWASWSCPERVSSERDVTGHTTSRGSPTSLLSGAAIC